MSQKMSEKIELLQNCQSFDFKCSSSDSEHNFINNNDASAANGNNHDTF